MRSPWREQKPTRSGTRAIVPSSFITSQITPDGLSPASRARSTAASVCPVRSSTPPGLALSGTTVPGRPRAAGGRGGGEARCPVVRPAPPAASLDRHVEGALERRLVLRGHQLQAELVAALRRQRQADEPARLARHE